MACGLATVATDVGGVPAIVTDERGEQCSRLVPPRRPELLARALLELAGDPELRRVPGRRARERVARFSADREWSEYASLYEAISRG